ncbi:right-handed parallel beta-helix repeat-containing protein [Paenibacillus rigui]|uniref:Pectate lyase superfamily protein domain-containing protein n=1 Tax=Paenibacillus rigui TaxID=554312 RepID=A0A229URA4_9BACL|nr:right-handed parallel beta-helix repeat-containing protein [Paenibacillus rigui]OXM85843.1 hypothetical protein CF651_11440 [Paenibacillus rigui]
MQTRETHADAADKPMTRRQLLASMGAAGALFAIGAGFTGETAYAASSTKPVTSSIPFYNVKDFGASGTGRLDDDDTAYIQSAINAAASSGGTVYFPPGKYVIRSTIFVKSKVHLLGDGAEATVLKAEADNLQMLLFGGSASHCSIEGFTFEGIGVPNGTLFSAVEKGVTIFEASHIAIHRCVFKYITNALCLTRADHVSITGCTFTFILGSDSLYEGYGIVVEGGSNHTIIGNHFKNVYRNCIYVTAGSTYSIIASNVMEQCKDSAILLSSKLTSCAHHLIQGNMISAAGLGSTETSSSYGIRLKDACSFNTVTGNVISQPASGGIQLDAEENAGDDKPYGNAVTGNTIDAAVRGIAVLNGDGNSIKSNEVRRAEIGVLIDTIGEGSGSLAKGNVVMNNSLFQCSTAAIKLGSARCQSNSVFGNAGSGNAEGLKDSGTDTATSGF